MGIPQPKEKDKKKRKSMPPRAKLWKLQSEYIRRKADGICFTCDARVWNEELGENNWKVMQAGHFRHGVLDFDLMNIHCQCVRCNKWLHGNAAEYARRLVKTYGAKAFEELCSRADRAKGGEKLTQEIFEKKYIYYKAQLAELVKAANQNG